MTAHATSFAFTSLLANTTESFEEALRFYISFGFEVTRTFTKDNTISTSDYLHGISTNSRREVWLEAFPLSQVDSKGGRVPLQESVGYFTQDNTATSSPYQSPGVVIKIRLASHDVHTLPKVAGEIIFFTAEVAKVRAVVEKNGYPMIVSHDSRVSFYTRDPLGTVLGFTSHPGMGSDLKVTSADYYLHPKRGPSVTAAERPATSPAAKSRKKIAVMTSGGDSPGMCAVVRAVVRAGIFYGCDVYGCYEGYSGLVQGGDMLKKMEWEDVRGWLSLGGTLIGTARCMEFKERWGRLQGAYNMIVAGIDALVVCGGDGSLTGADLFRSEWPSLVDELVATGKLTESEVAEHRHLNIVGLVGSIDNDMSSTDSTIGAYSSLERICEMVDYIDSTANSHSRAFVVEVMGRHCGWLALMAGIATGADYIFIPEQPPKAGEWQAELKKVCMRHRDKGRRKTTVIVAEGALDDLLTPITSEEVKDVLVEIGLDTRITTLGHVQRGGTAVAFDRMLATLQGVDAVKAVLEMTPDTPSPMIGIVENNIVRRNLVDAVRLTKSVATAIEARDFEKAMSLRDTVFVESYDNFLAVSKHDDGSVMLPEEKRLNMAIIHVGAPSSALNAATRAAALNCISKGHNLYAIQNGFSGLIRHGSFKKLSWLDVEEWHNLGGSEIGTNRSLPEQDMGTVAYYFQKYRLDGLIVAGGFEAFRALHQLQAARGTYPIFNIPMVCLPATVSNNVPGTQYSLGTDTCLNTLVNYCDAVKQSASASRRRVFVVEVQGGNSGYVAAYSGLVSGALAVYTPEKEVTLRSVQEDLKLLHDNFEHDKGDNRSGKMFIRNEKASSIFSTELIADIIKEAGKGKFESRTAIPGHVQQGKTPSSMDRVNATRFAIKACDFIEDWNSRFAYSTSQAEAEGLDCESELRFVYNRGTKHYLVDDIEASAVVAGIYGSAVMFTKVTDLWKTEADHDLRKGKTIHWENLNVVNDMLSGRLLLRRS
ncbi:unnamed protein product [Kuraishia capsulata CBS 1993]|uniref:ATP-dependent 6-phosphofructokinase n=1 Tax=Kuraishia capsulata CBS 1993 TaxID=1382522 RepID=W6MM64_9ASCO|nr:uncharacterized protein KUCA_T00003261001 [Kuraishia capsulata CBS 1993]CDK27283.1 unnamed protein product [Kuraishia capsulata CBS 1993]